MKKIKIKSTIAVRKLTDELEKNWPWPRRRRRRGQGQFSLSLSLSLLGGTSLDFLTIAFAFFWRTSFKTALFEAFERLEWAMVVSVTLRRRSSVVLEF